MLFPVGTIESLLINNFGLFDLLFTGGKTPDVHTRTYTQIMREQMLQGEESEVIYSYLSVSIESIDLTVTKMLIHFIVLQLRKKIQEKSKDGTLVKSTNGDASKASEPRKRGRWDQTIDDQFVPAKKATGAVTPTWNDVEVYNKFHLFDRMN